MESQNNKSIDDLDKVVGKFLRHFFNFFKLPEFVPRKWRKKYKALLEKIYTLRYELQEHIITKDAALEELNINDWVDTIESYILELRELLSELTEIDDENKKAVLEKFDAEVEQLEDDLKEILENQEAYPWYTGDGTTPVCFIDLTGVNNAVVDVGIEGETTTSYTGGRVYGVLPNYYTFKITPVNGYVCERTVTPTVLNYSGSFSYNYNDTNFTFTLHLTEDYNGQTIYIGYNPNSQTYVASVSTNISGATAFLNNMAFTSTKMQLPCTAKIVLQDMNNYKNGDTPTITGYTGSSNWYLSGNDWTFQDTLGTEYDGKILTINYNAEPLIYQTVTINDVSGGYSVYINGTHTFMAIVETSETVEIVCYLVDGFTSAGTPTVVSGIDSQYVTITEIIDERTELQTGWSISFNAADMTGDVTMRIYSSGQIVETNYRIYWDNDYLQNVNIIFGEED